MNLFDYLISATFNYPNAYVQDFDIISINIRKRL